MDQIKTIIDGALITMALLKTNTNVAGTLSHKDYPDGLELTFSDMADIASEALLAAAKDIDLLSRKNEELQAENFRLRKWMAVRCSGASDLYHEDGELQDNRVHPFIDYKRDSVDEIIDKMAQRAEAARGASDAHG